MHNDQDIQDDREVYEIIHSEVTKTKEQQIVDLRKVNGVLRLNDKTKNGFIAAALSLLSYNEPFVEYFFKNKDNFDKKKPFSMILENVFRQMYRSTELANDRETVLISDLRRQFRFEFK